MEEWAIREMIADWIGAAIVYNGEYPDFKNWVWYKENKDKMQLHSYTKIKIDLIIQDLIEIENEEEREESFYDQS